MASMAGLQRLDGWANVATGLGRSARDKRLGATIQHPVPLSQQELTDLYTGDGIARRICNLPAEDQTRKWITLQVGDDQEGGRMRNFGEPELYRIRTDGSLLGVDGQPLRPHVRASRVLRFDNLTPSLQRKRNDGWSDSIFVSLYCLQDEAF